MGTWYEVTDQKDVVSSLFSDASDDRASNDRDREGEWQMVQSSVSHSANTAQYLTSHKSAGLLNFDTDTVMTSQFSENPLLLFFALTGVLGCHLIEIGMLDETISH